MSICNRCSTRKCRSSPTMKHGREYCYKFVKPKSGWPMIEILMENSPLEVLELCHNFGLQVRETSNGELKITYKP